jgi:hypothetical protein
MGGGRRYLDTLRRSAQFEPRFFPKRFPGRPIETQPVPGASVAVLTSMERIRGSEDVRLSAIGNTPMRAKGRFLSQSGGAYSGTVIGWELEDAALLFWSCPAQ